MRLHFFLLIPDSLLVLLHDLYLRRGFLGVALEHLPHCVSFPFQLELLLCVGVADDVLNGGGGSGLSREYLLGIP